MAQWKGTLKLKDLLTDEDVSDEQVAAIGMQFSERIRASDVFDEGRRSDLAGWFECVDSEDEFNCLLDILYDVADAERIWIE